MSANDHQPHFHEGGLIQEYSRPIPWWLKAMYIVLPIWGVIILFAYWGGSWGWMDPGTWRSLQEASQTGPVLPEKGL
jgi:hypothetical protein